ncbi:hypothetical protein H2203_003547 [Taxawa tesnikishii (nom. ined.)]|nr:hypothetical protein H2203_003547 [Dothideales sp. JES 119]
MSLNSGTDADERDCAPDEVISDCPTSWKQATDNISLLVNDVIYLPCPPEKPALLPCPIMIPHRHPSHRKRGLDIPPLHREFRRRIHNGIPYVKAVVITGGCIGNVQFAVPFPGVKLITKAATLPFVITGQVQSRYWANRVFGPRERGAVPASWTFAYLCKYKPNAQTGGVAMGVETEDMGAGKVFAKYGTSHSVSSRVNVSELL